MRHVDSFEIQPPTPPSHQRRAPVGVGPCPPPGVPLAPALHRWSCCCSTSARRRSASWIADPALRPGRLRLLRRQARTRPGSTRSRTCCCRWAGCSSSGATGAYDRRYLGLGPDEFKRVIRASVTVAASVSFLAFATKTAALPVHRRHRAASAPLLLILLGRDARPARAALDAPARPATPRTGWCWSARCRRRWRSTPRSPAHPAAGLVPVGHPPHRRVRRRAAASRRPVPVYAGRDVLALVREVGGDTIAVCGSASAEPGELRRLAWQLEGTGVDLVVAPQLTDIAGPRVHIRPIEGLPLLHVEEPTLSGPALLVKNLMDRVAAGARPAAARRRSSLAIAIAIRISDPGPVFFRQPRVGHEGQTFRVWKFRTMYVDAEERLASLVDQNETDGMLFKIKERPAGLPGRPVPARHLARRAAPADQRALGRDVAGRAAPAARRRRRLPRRRPPPAAGPPRHDRAVAGLRPLRPVLGRGGPARPLLRRQLVARRTT